MRRGESVTMASGFSKIDFYASRMRMEARIEEEKNREEGDSGEISLEFQRGV